MTEGGAETVPSASPWRGRLLLAAKLAVVAALLVLVARPAAGPRRFPERIPVRFWHMWAGEWQVVVERIVQRFNDSQDRYEVIPLLVPMVSADQKFLMSVTGGDPPDVMAQWNNVIPAWAEDGLLTPLDTLMPAAQWQELQRTAYPVAMKIGCYRGHLYGVTIGINVFACYYRPQHLAEAGLDAARFPATLEGLAAWGDRLDRSDADGRLVRLGFMPGQTNLLATYAPLFGGGFADPASGAPAIDTPGNLKALEFLAACSRQVGPDRMMRFQSSLNTGGFATEWPFISGQYSICVDGQWRVEQLARYAPELDYRTAPLPSPAGGPPLAGFSYGNFMIVPTGAKHAAGAWEFIKFWSGIEHPEVAAEFYTWGGWMPPTPAIAAAPSYQAYVAKYPQFRTFLDILPSANLQVPPPVPWQVLLMDKLKLGENAVIEGRRTPRQALDELAAAVAQELRRRERTRR
jgi:multiple sugar transport system substrate-binding protein